MFLWGLRHTSEKETASLSFMLGMIWMQTTSVQIQGNFANSIGITLNLPQVWKGALEKTHSLHTRGLIELAGAISCGTGRNALAYLGYGCYCGLGGRGWPKDDVDWCCHKHDCCYDKAEREGCNPKMLRYEWTCERNTVVCNRLTDRCQKMVCQCDREAARCWGIAPYNPHYVLWPDFLCGQTNPMCQLT
nr:phospholipase A2-like isoform X1 [Pelodiscus sinensis]|eukprot:XP_014433440.2 phospholipase A2-like isoform X1 [Pelodiscus sinensis]